MHAVIKTIQMQLEQGNLTLNQVREKIGLPKIVGGDEHLIISPHL